jgi:quercetin dioxygenase-like cupin family protein/DNA-binding XRE family transcriptional regulator
VSVRGLARDIGVSASLISQIETDKSLPSVSTLYAITTALDVGVEELFAPSDPDAPATAVSAGAAHAVGMPTPDRTIGSGPHLCAGERDVLTLDSGVTWERLGQLPGHHVDFLLVTYRPDATSGSGEGLMRHTGTEYGYLTSGELILTLGFEEYAMKVGDSVCFDSTTPHGYRNESSEPAVGVWFVQEDD